MPSTELGNYISRTFRGPRPADVERDRYSNALARNEVDRLPQQNKAQDLAIQGAEMEISDAQRKNAAGVLGRNFSIAAQSPRPRDAARALIGSPEFQTAGKLVGLPIDQFTVTDQDTDDTIRQQLQTWAQTLNGGQQQRVQSTQVLEDGTIAYVTSDGRVVRTNEKARNDLRFVESGGGTGAFDPRAGTISPITTAGQETAAAAERAGAEAWARAAAAAGVDIQKEQVGRQGTLGVWQVAREDLMAALGGTTTGPFAGRVPAVTASQQIAAGAIAAVTPVLKQLFRSAGEGVFTDRDQQLLIDMIPSRTDLPEARVFKMRMIDSIIEAKLRAPSMPQQFNQPGQTQPGQPAAPQAAPQSAPGTVNWKDL